MKRLEIDVLGKAPSLEEIETCNKFHRNKCLLSTFGIILMYAYLLLSPSDVGVVFVFAIVFSVFFVVGLSSIEVFVSHSKYLYLSQFIEKHPEIALYRDQVVAHRRAFLKSEYKAFLDFVERKAYKEIYKVNVIV